MAYQHN